MKIIFGGKLLFLFIVFMQYSCEDSEKVYKIKLATSTNLGKYLTDANGHTLYFYSNDPDGISDCIGNCIDTWPYFYAKDLNTDDLGPGLEIRDFDTVVVNGFTQTRYKSWPLYYHAPLENNQNIREEPGEINGDGFDGEWFVAKPDYTLMLAKAQLVGFDGKNYTGNYIEGNGKTVYLTDGNGLTLYTFVRDSAKNNSFTKSDFSNNGIFPIFQAKDVIVPSTLDKSLFDSTIVHGKKQLTFKGWPLYYFGMDEMVRGSTKGVSFPVPGLWPVAVTRMLAAP